VPLPSGCSSGRRCRGRPVAGCRPPPRPGLGSCHLHRKPSHGGSGDPGGLLEVLLEVLHYILGIIKRPSFLQWPCARRTCALPRKGALCRALAREHAISAACTRQRQTEGWSAARILVACQLLADWARVWHTKWPRQQAPEAGWRSMRHLPSEMTASITAWETPPLGRRSIISVSSGRHSAAARERFWIVFYASRDPSALLCSQPLKARDRARTAHPLPAPAAARRRRRAVCWRPFPLPRSCGGVRTVKEKIPGAGSTTRGCRCKVWCGLLGRICAFEFYQDGRRRAREDGKV
jgi:hypothetical protein